MLYILYKDSKTRLTARSRGEAIFWAAAVIDELYPTVATVLRERILLSLTEMMLSARVGHFGEPGSLAIS
jgi:hypothetical protein